MNILHPQVLRIQPFTPLLHPRFPTTLSPIRSSINGQGNNDGPPSPPPITPPDTVEIRFRRGSRRRQRERQQQQENGGNELPKKTAVPAKSWEEMSMSEKAMELYMGEKGLLFWLNKFAYASIFIIIGGWILFRFVGPSLNLYQLDSPPLSPTSILKGS